MRIASSRRRGTLQSPSRVEGYKMRTLSQEVNASGIRPTEGLPARHSTILKFSSALMFAAALALAPAPAFAQHGGGGGGAGGGGGSAGGGGGGGLHGGGGGGGGDAGRGARGGRFPSRWGPRHLAAG